jgi:hypothetical protein
LIAGCVQSNGSIHTNSRRANSSLDVGLSKALLGPLSPIHGRLEGIILNLLEWKEADSHRLPTVLWIQIPSNLQNKSVGIGFAGVKI